MKKWFKIFAFCTLVFCVARNGLAQRLNYKIKAGGIKLGDFKLEKHVFNDTTIYLLKSQVTVNFLIAKHVVDYSSLTTYYKGKLIESIVKAETNGELDKKTTTTKISTGYHVKKYEDEETTEYNFTHHGIGFSSTRLFFEKPVLPDSSFAELYGNFGYIDEKAKNEITIINQKTGSVTIYYYKNNNPEKRKIEYPILDFMMFLTSKEKVISTKNQIYQEFFGKEKTSP